MPILILIISSSSSSSSSCWSSPWPGVAASESHASAPRREKVIWRIGDLAVIVIPTRSNIIMIHESHKTLGDGGAGEDMLSQWVKNPKYETGERFLLCINIQQIWSSSRYPPWVLQLGCPVNNYHWLSLKSVLHRVRIHIIPLIQYQCQCPNLQFYIVCENHFWFLKMFKLQGVQTMLIYLQCTSLLLWFKPAVFNAMVEKNSLSNCDFFGIRFCPL